MIIGIPSFQVPDEASSRPGSEVRYLYPYQRYHTETWVMMYNILWNDAERYDRQLQDAAAKMLNRTF